MKTETTRFNFGWGKAWKIGFLASAIIFLALSLGTYVFLPYLRLAAFFLFLVSLNLLAGHIAMRYVNKYEAELVLPFVDLFSSDNDLILDAGCGSGRTTIAVSKVMKNGKIVALDKFDAPYIKDGGKTLIESNLEIAGISDKVRMVTGDITALEFADNTFDTVVSSYMIDHLGEKKLIALKEINRVLKTGGKFLLIVIVPNYFTFAVASFLSVILFTSRKRWKELFQQSGFRCLEEGDINGGAFYLLEKL